MQRVTGAAHLASRPVARAGKGADSTQITRALLMLREQILAGEFAAGQRMSELPLVDRLGVSRTPLRLALATLEHEGLLAKLPGGGYTVREFSQAEIADAIELRGVLEGTAARFAAERGASNRELRSMADLNDQMAALMEAGESDFFTRYVALNERFHARLLKLARSTQLERVWAGVVALPFAGPSAFVLTESELGESHQILRFANHQHTSLLEAIEQRQGTRAESVARDHARIALANLELVMRERAMLVRIRGASLISHSSAGPGHDPAVPVGTEPLAKDVVSG
jgi:GntR family transcriptional regulator, vanillate catabolism transcriptional regulator